MAYNKNYHRKIENKTKKVAKKVTKKHPVLAFFLVIVFIGVIVGGYYAYNKYFKKPAIVASGEISFHFMTLGNGNAGDSVYIKAGNNDILIDAGSKENSKDDIQKYVDKYCADKTLEFVIATHAHEDHIASFGCEGGIFDYYDCKTIIDFSKTNSTSATYNKYVQKRDKEVSESGAKHFTALECYNESKDGAKKVFDLGDSLSMEILYNYYYDHNSSDENNYSVCVLFRHGERKFLFTGDLEKEGEEKLAEKYPNMGQVELFKAGHHGSKTSSNDCLLNIIKPKKCVVCCCCGADEYTGDLDNVFPTQDFINRISKWTDCVYVTSIFDTYTIETAVANSKGKSNKTGVALGKQYIHTSGYKDMNGNICVSSYGEDNSKGKTVEVVCSNNNTKLKDSEWFSQTVTLDGIERRMRTMPTAWAS